MSIRFTKRPQNFCSSCGYSWYPRGKSVSAACPRCGSEGVTTLLGALLNVLFALLTLPLLPIALLVRLATALIALLVRLATALIAPTLSLGGRAATQAAPAVGHAIASLVTRLARAAYAAERPIASLVTRLARAAYAAAAFSVKWVASARDDLYAEGDHEVNPTVLVAKLLVFFAASAGSLILAINLVLFASSHVR
jgi:hypothetical protein